MKQKDFLIIIVVAIVSGVIAFFISNAFFSTSADRSQKVEEIDKISADFPTPNKRFFNTESVNPTQQVEIGTGGTDNPFNDSSQ